MFYITEKNKNNTDINDVNDSLFSYHFSSSLDETICEFINLTKLSLQNTEIKKSLEESENLTEILTKVLYPNENRFENCDKYESRFNTISDSDIYNNNCDNVSDFDSNINANSTMSHFSVSNNLCDTVPYNDDEHGNISDTMSYCNSVNSNLYDTMSPYESDVEENHSMYVSTSKENYTISLASNGDTISDIILDDIDFDVPFEDIDMFDSLTEEEIIELDRITAMKKIVDQISY